VLPVIRIGAIDSITCTWMPHLIEALRDRLPTLK
jgi:DNA-binding transcriptional LysR family regulator